MYVYAHAIYVVYVSISYKSAGTYSLKSTPNHRFLSNFSWQFFYLHSEFLSEICWEEVAVEIYIFFIQISFYLRYLTWYLNHGLISYKPIHYLLDYGDFSSLFTNDIKFFIPLTSLKIFAMRNTIIFFCKWREEQILRQCVR